MLADYLKKRFGIENAQQTFKFGRVYYFSGSKNGQAVEAIIDMERENIQVDGKFAGKVPLDMVEVAAAREVGD